VKLVGFWVEQNTRGNYMTLTPGKVMELKQRIANGEYESLTRLGHEFNVSRQAVSDVANDATWKHVPWPTGFNYNSDSLKDTPTKEKKYTLQEPITNAGNVLAIGDLHGPFTLDGYLSFCKEQQDRFKCDMVVFMGDIIDNHYASFHPTDPDGLSGGDELELAIEKNSHWVKAFSDAWVTTGNHDRMCMRKAFDGGIPSRWIRDYNEVLEAPGWKFVDEIVIDNVQYEHGEGGSARIKARNDKFSTVQGHLHTQAYCESLIGRDTCIFGMQVGCGIDRRAYAMAYAKNSPKPAIGCGIVLDNGRLPIQIMADLTEKRFRNNQ
jgi:predicted phosphodiesterase